MALFLVSLLATTSLVAANSKGIGIPCDVDVDVGSNDVMDKQPTINMWWALKAVHAPDKYTLRTGDGAPASDPTTYMPGSWTEIYIRSHIKHTQFTGIVMYAEDALGNKVGQWALNPKRPFHKPSDCVVHQNADKKAYLEKFRVAIPAGTGPVVIKALLKYGLANPNKDGFFAWPNNAHLTLQEGTPEVNPWMEGLPGESCDVACARAGGTCNLGLMKSVGQSKALYDAVKTATTCTLPMMAGCSAASPAVSDEGCFFHDDTCKPPAAPPVVTRDCTDTCGSGSAGWPMAIGKCCTFTQHHAKSGCQCLDMEDTGGVYSEYNGVWSPGRQPGDTPAPTPAPPKKEELTCGAVITWNDNARRLCACSGATAKPPPFTPDDTPTPRPTGGLFPGPPPTPSAFEPCIDHPQYASDCPGWENTCDSNPDFMHFYCKETCGLCGLGSGAGKNSFGAAIFMAFASTLALFASSGSSSRRSSSVGSLAIVICLCLVFLPASEAHNWMTSPARGNEAGENNGFNGFTTAPCPQKSARIHAQVGPGQIFPVEWAAGHGFGSFTYFALIKAGDEKHLAKHDFDLFDDYLANAPSTDYLSQYPVHHVSHNGNSHGMIEAAELGKTYHWVPSQADTIGVRPAGFRNFGASPSVKRKTDGGRAQDKRAKYENPKYPWLISVSKFLMRYDFPEDADTTMFEVPSELGSGSYVLHYMWSGYYDCVDINVLDVPSTDLWGSDGGTTGFDRIDHCQVFEDYPGYQITGTCVGVNSENIQPTCSGVCGAGCEAIQVMQSQLDPRVSAAGVFTGTEHLPAACAAAAAGSTHVCFGVKFGEPKVGPSYALSSDPEDPIFYNSCFKKSAGWTFQQTCATCPRTSVEPGWLFGDHCITCDEMRTNAGQGGYLPTWEFATGASDCRHCDRQG